MQLDKKKKQYAGSREEEAKPVITWRWYDCIFRLLRVSLVAQAVKNLPAMQEARVWSRGRVGKIPWRRKWQATPIFLPGKSHGQRSLEATVQGGSRVKRDLVTKPPPPLLTYLKFTLLNKVYSSVVFSISWNYATITITKFLAFHHPKDKCHLCFPCITEYPWSPILCA